MTAQSIDISFVSDGLRLNGVLHLPENPEPPVIVGSHGLASDGDSPKQIELAHACNHFGIAFFRFHHRGCGTSEGFFPDVTSLENRKKDLIAAVNTVLSRNDTGRRLALFGSSMGGTTCIAAAEELKAEALVVVAAPVSGKTLKKAPERQDGEPVLTDAFYERFLQFDVTEKISSIRNILIFHGDHDDVVPLENGKTLFSLAGDPKRLIVQKNGDHRITAPDHQIEFIREASQWFRSCFSV